MKKKTNKPNVQSLTKKTVIYTVAIGFILVIVCLAIQSLVITKSRTSPAVSAKVEKTLKEKLADCLPKSDMGSKKICDDLIKSITTFKDCSDAGFPIKQSNPPKCSTPDGRYFTSSKK